MRGASTGGILLQSPRRGLELTLFQLKVLAASEGIAHRGPQDLIAPPESVTMRVLTQVKLNSIQLRVKCRDSWLQAGFRKAGDEPLHPKLRVRGACQDLADQLDTDCVREPLVDIIGDFPAPEEPSSGEGALHSDLADQKLLLHLLGRIQRLLEALDRILLLA